MTSFDILFLGVLAVVWPVGLLWLVLFCCRKEDWLEDRLIKLNRFISRRRRP